MLCDGRRCWHCSIFLLCNIYLSSSLHNPPGCSNPSGGPNDMLTNVCFGNGVLLYPLNLTKHCMICPLSLNRFACAKYLHLTEAYCFEGFRDSFEFLFCWFQGKVPRLLCWILFWVWSGEGRKGHCQATPLSPMNGPFIFRRITQMPYCWLNNIKYSPTRMGL